VTWQAAPAVPNVRNAQTYVVLMCRVGSTTWLVAHYADAVERRATITGL
jgi:hypothetical protein